MKKEWISPAMKNTALKETRNVVCEEAAKTPMPLAEGVDFIVPDFPREICCNCPQYSACTTSFNYWKYEGPCNS